MGSPAALNPQGAEIDGCPVKLNRLVFFQTSFSYPSGRAESGAGTLVRPESRKGSLRRGLRWIGSSCHKPALGQGGDNRALCRREGTIRVDDTVDIHFGRVDVQGNLPKICCERLCVGGGDTGN